MLKNMTKAEWITIHEYSIDFDTDDGGGFTFPCDETGKVLDSITDEAKTNYEWCLQHPEKFVRFKEFKHFKRQYKEPAHGTCKCGEVVELVNEYMGACECPNCGQWYNLFGQELLPPEQWEEDY